MATPKIFISYSWSSPSHQSWVIQLATELVESGIDVILDKWDLKIGQESIAFMESMVTDSSINKVLIISDSTYADKADGRSGGVGTETQIISKHIYQQVDEERFIAVIAEKDESGRACLPTFYNSRIYIDLSQAESYSENFEALVRCIYDKPQFLKPSLGKRPEFLNDQSISLGTSALQKRTISAIRESKPFVSGALSEYLAAYASNLEKFRAAHTENELFDETIIKSIDKLLPARNEYLQVFSNACRYLEIELFIPTIHRFFESLIPYLLPPKDINNYQSYDFDNFKFFIHELFLYTITHLIKSDNFSAANNLLTLEYYISQDKYGRSGTQPYTIFYENLKSLSDRNQRLALKRTSLRSDILKARTVGTGIDFRELMQADFVLFVRSQLDKSDYWWPESLVYLEHYHGALEIFSRAASLSYFNKIKPLLNISTPSELDAYNALINSSSARIPMWGYSPLNIMGLLNYNNLGSKP